MALPDDLLTLRETVLADLVAAHDYYADTQVAWMVVEQSIRNGNTFTNQNRLTGTVTTQTDLALRAQDYVARQLAEATFQQFLSIFENFYLDLLRLWLTAYPRSLGKKTLNFQTILDLPDKDAITQLVVRKELNEVLYDRPTEWFAYLEARAKLGCPTTAEVERIAEAKATRDLLVHNRGIANRTYEAKAGKLARFREGERIDIPEQYHRATWELLCQVVATIAAAAIAKAS